MNLRLSVFYSGLIWLVSFFTCFAQVSTVADSLIQKLAHYEAQKFNKGSYGIQPSDTVQVNILSKIVENLYMANPKTALVYADKQLKLSQQLNYQWGISNSFNQLGVLHDFAGNYPDAVHYYKKSLSIKHKISDFYGQVDAYINLGVVYSKQYDYTTALAYLYKGYAIAKNNNDNSGVFAIYNNIGLIYQTQKKYDKALKYYLDCLKIRVSNNDAYYKAITYQNIGDLYFLMGDLKQASLHFHKGLRLATLSDNTESAANGYDGLGKINQQKKAYKQAVLDYEKALQLRKRIEDIQGIAFSELHLGAVYFELGAYEKSKLLLYSSLSKAKELGELETMAESYNLLAKIFEVSGNYKLAYANQLLFKETNDLIFNNEKENKLTEIQLTYHFKTVQDSLNVLQEKKNLLLTEEVKAQKKTRNFIYVILSLLLLFLIVLLVQKNKIATIRRQKALEEERNRIKRNLHDDLGAQLSAVRIFLNSIKNHNDPLQINETVENSLGLLDASIEHLRNIICDIQSSVLVHFGYIAATEELVNKINPLNIIQFTLSHHNIKKRFDSVLEHELFRITQELVNNTLKHANARNVFIQVLVRDKRLVFMYEDDGIGFDVVHVRKGNGLDNTEARVVLLNGEVHFDSSPDLGFRTTIEIPL